MIRVIALLSLLFIFGLTSLTAYAGDEKVATSSFELFWPLGPGKTIDESFYFLKTLKENIRGLLIFNPAQKADYQVLLGTKRVLEAEKLIENNRDQPTLKTIDLASQEFDKALENWQKPAQSGNNAPLKINIKNRLDNLAIFLPTLSSKTEGEKKDKLDNLKQLIDQFLQKL